MTESVAVATKSESGRERSLQNLIPHRIKPGQVLNPRGAGSSGHSLAQHIRTQTLDGIEIVDFLLNVMRGQEGLFATVKYRLIAAGMLLDRGWGQAQQTVSLIDGKTQPLFDLRKLSPAEFEQFKALATKIAPSREIDSESQSAHSQTVPPASTDAPQATISPSDVPNVAPPKI